MKSVHRAAWGAVLFAGVTLGGVRPAAAQLINGGFEAPADPAAEPWPPMRASGEAR